MQLATISNEIKCYDWPLGMHFTTYAPQMETPLSIRSASWACNCGWMCVVTSHGVIEILSFADKHVKQLCCIQDITDVNYATFQNVTKRNLAIAKDDKILIYDMKNQRIKKEYAPTPNHSDFVKLKFDSRDIHLCGATKDNRIYVYNQAGAYNTFQACNIGTLTNFAVNDRSAFKLAACTNTGACIVWELDGVTNIHNEPSKFAIHDVVFDQSNCLLYITDNRCVFRDSYNTTTISEFDLPYSPKCIDFCNDGIGFAICADDGTVYAYDVRNLGDSINKLPHDGCSGKVVQIAFDKYCKTDTIKHYDTLSLSKISCNSDLNYGQLVKDFDEYPDVEQNLNEHDAVAAVPFDVIHFDQMQISIASDGEDSQDIMSINSSIKTDDTIKNEQIDRTLEIRNVINDVIKDEMKRLKCDLQRLVQNVIYDTTQKNFLDLQMAMVKEFIKIENILTNLQVSTMTNSIRHFDK